MDSKQKKYLIFGISSIIILFITIITILLLNIKKQYNQKIYEYVNETVNLISKKYNEAESDIIQQIINNITNIRNCFNL